MLQFILHFSLSFYDSSFNKQKLSRKCKKVLLLNTLDDHKVDGYTIKNITLFIYQPI